jgi:iron complex transport system substrate-binding protein
MLSSRHKFCRGAKVAQKRLLPELLIAVAVCMFLWGTASAETRESREGQSITVTDQLGRIVTVPAGIERIAALHFLPGKIVFALHEQDKLVCQGLLRDEGKAMARIDPVFASKPSMMPGTFGIEALMALRPDVAIVYASFDRAEVGRMEKAGIKVIAVRGENFSEGYEAVRLIGRLLGCEEKGEAYIRDCERLLGLVRTRVADIPRRKRPRVMFLGPKGAYDVATGEMLQSTILREAGGENVASGLKGRWPSVSPEQIIAWDPDVIFLGSTWGSYGVDRVLHNSQLQGVKAVRNHKVFIFPSNIGWWDYPAPHCVLGVLWAAKVLHPDRFEDISLKAMADDFYARYLGHSFTSLGGKIEP